MSNYGEKEWIEAMKADYKCKYVEFQKFQGVMPQYFQGFRVVCGLNGEDCEGSCEVNG